MLKPLNILLLTLIFNVVLGQDTNVNKYNENIILSFNTDLGYGATSINNDFIDKLIFGGKISNEIKDKALSKTKSTNRLGVELNYEFKFYNMKDTFLISMPKYRYYIGFGSFTNISAQYSADFFETAFYGNKNFVGETAHLGKSNVFQSTFRKISFGLINKEKHTSFAISLISGEKHNLYNFSKVDLYTSPNGENITLDYEGKIENSDSISNGFLSFSGSGVGFDFSTRIKKVVNLNIQNLGFVVWGRNPASSQINNQYNFNGIEVQNIFDNNSFDINSTIDSILPPEKSNNIIVLLPAIIKAEKVIISDKKIQLTYGFRYKILSNYTPLIHVGTFYSFSNKLKSSIALTYGGYNNFEGRFNIYYTSKKLYFGLGTNNLLGSLSKNGYGKSASFSLMTLF